MQRFVCTIMTLLVMQLCSLPYSSLAYGQEQTATDTQVVNPKQSLQLPAAAPAEEPRIAFKSGVKYDPTVHQWVDRYSGKSVDLGLPGVIGRYGVKNVIADNDVVADSSSPGSSGGPGSGGPTVSYFTWKNFIIITILGLGIATSIAVPVALGAHHHHHHNFNQQNQLAIYSFFHNQTLPIPKLILPPPPPIIHSGGNEGGGGGGGGNVVKLLLGR